MADFHRILGVSRDADTGEIKRAYRQLARQHHPDTSGENGRHFQEIRRAYEALTSEKLRSSRRGDRLVEIRPEPPTGPDAWLSDEVAIDFPSVDAILDRIRQSFFGRSAGPARLSAAIELTAGEALGGVIVPIDVPVWCPCAMCGGCGDLSLQVCPGCRGSGGARGHHTVRLSVPRGVPDGARVRLTVTAHQTPPTIVDIRIVVR